MSLVGIPPVGGDPVGLVGGDRRRAAIFRKWKIRPGDPARSACDEPMDPSEKQGSTWRLTAGMVFAIFLSAVVARRKTAGGRGSVPWSLT
jgi:hypothetical protein